jgi:hypothetical protein
VLYSNTHLSVLIIHHEETLNDTDVSYISGLDWLFVACVGSWGDLCQYPCANGHEGLGCSKTCNCSKKQTCSRKQGCIYKTGMFAHDILSVIYIRWWYIIVEDRQEVFFLIVFFRCGAWFSRHRIILANFARPQSKS